MALTAREHLASATTIANHELVTHLEKSQSALETLVRGLQDFICICTAEGRILWGNDKAASWFGCDVDLLHRNNLEQLLTDAWPEFSSQLNSKAGPERVSGDLEFEIEVSLSGQRRNILWNLQPFQQVSERRGRVLLISGRDITEILAERRERVRLESELETAMILQSAFFPNDHIKRPPIEIAAFYRPAERCSGDWWGHFSLGPQLDLICISDVSGHGAASALVTAMTQATCMNFAAQHSASEKREASIPTLLKQLNRVIFETFHGATYMTFFALLFDTAAREVFACNAGHNFPFVLHQSVNKERSWPDPLMLGGNPLGCEESPVYATKNWPFLKGDRFTLFTDGLIECRGGPSGKPFGSAGLRRSMVRHKDEDVLRFRDLVMEDALAYYGAVPLRDDITFVVIDT